MKKIIITGAKLTQLAEMHEDCLDLKKKNDLTEWGNAEMYVLGIMFEGKNA